MNINAKVSCCPFCDSRSIIKKGLRKNYYRHIQLYFCKTCLKYFSPLPMQGVKYTPPVILRTISYFNLGYSQEEVSQLISTKYHVTVPRRTISDWIKRFSPVCSYHKLRPSIKLTYKPKDVIETLALNHQQVYRFQIHIGKLSCNLNSEFISLKNYLASIKHDIFPHAIFQGENPTTTPIQSRSSQIEFPLLPFPKSLKQNAACDLATLGLQLAQHNKQRHEEIQSFMLTNDAVTVAVEVPVYLTPEDIAYYNQRNFHLNFTTSSPITGHIDFVQIRNNRIYILDYKPEASKVNPANQLVIYALALASRTKLPLKYFSCAWFDEKNYFEFYPLAAVYSKKTQATLN